MNGYVLFIVVVGVAATAHGSARLTYLRGAPPGLPFVWDERTVSGGLNFTLTTNLGPLDLLGEITGGGNYQQLLPHTFTLKAFGVECPATVPTATLQSHLRWLRP